MKIMNGFMTMTSELKEKTDTLRDELRVIANYFADAKVHEMEQTILEAIKRIDSLTHTMNGYKENCDWYRDRVVWGFYEDQTPHYIQGKAGEHEINEPVTAEQVRNLYKALDVYKRERDRYRHAKPEITGEFFLSGGHGERDDNMLPKYVTICPAYGAGWDQVYERTERTVSYEGS
jgi:hypothetical protein